MKVQIKPDSKRYIRGSEDVPALIQELEDEGWAGPRLGILTDDAWLYGWDILRGKVRKGQMGTINAGNVPAPVLSETALSLLMNDNAAREAVVVDTLLVAVPALVDHLRKGKFDPSKGAALETYFTTGCALAYKDVATRWSNSLGKRWASLEDVVDTLFEPIPGDWDDKVDRYQMRHSVGILLRDMSDVQRQIAARVALGMTHGEISEELKMSPRAVEGQMYRVRKMAWAKVNHGNLSELFTLGILTPRPSPALPDFDGLLDQENLRSHVEVPDELPDWICAGLTP